MIDHYSNWMTGIGIAAYFVMSLFSFGVFYKVYKMYRLSGHKGVFYLAVSQLMYGVGFLALTIVKVLPLCPIPVYIISHCMQISHVVFAYGLTAASLYLLYSMLYKHITYSHKLIQVLLHIFAISVAVITQYGHIVVLFVTQLLLLVPALFFTHKSICTLKSRGCVLYFRVISVLILVWAVELLALLFPQAQLVADALIVIAGGVMLYIVTKITG